MSGENYNPALMDGLQGLSSCSPSGEPPHANQQPNPLPQFSLQPQQTPLAQPQCSDSYPMSPQQEPPAQATLAHNHDYQAPHLSAQNMQPPQHLGPAPPSMPVLTSNNLDPAYQGAPYTSAQHPQHGIQQAPSVQLQGHQTVSANNAFPQPGQGPGLTPVAGQPANTKRPKQIYINLGMTFCPGIPEIPVARFIPPAGFINFMHRDHKGTPVGRKTHCRFCGQPNEAPPHIHGQKWYQCQGSCYFCKQMHPEHYLCPRLYSSMRKLVRMLRWPQEADAPAYLRIMPNETQHRLLQQHGFVTSEYNGDYVPNFTDKALRCLPELDVLKMTPCGRPGYDIEMFGTNQGLRTTQPTYQPQPHRGQHYYQPQAFNSQPSSPVAPHWPQSGPHPGYPSPSSNRPQQVAPTSSFGTQAPYPAGPQHHWPAPTAAPPDLADNMQTSGYPYQPSHASQHQHQQPAPYHPSSLHHGPPTPAWSSPPQLAGSAQHDQRQLMQTSGYTSQAPNGPQSQQQTPNAFPQWQHPPPQSPYLPPPAPFESTMQAPQHPSYQPQIQAQQEPTRGFTPNPAYSSSMPPPNHPSNPALTMPPPQQPHSQEAPTSVQGFLTTPQTHDPLPPTQTPNSQQLMSLPNRQIDPTPQPNPHEPYPRSQEVSHSAALNPGDRAKIVSDDRISRRERRVHNEAVDASKETAQETSRPLADRATYSDGSVSRERKRKIPLVERVTYSDGTSYAVKRPK